MFALVDCRYTGEPEQPVLSLNWGLEHVQRDFAVLV
jgi:hypothetical protein